MLCTFPLDHKPDGIGRTLRRMGRLGRQQEDLALLNVNVLRHAIIDDLHGGITFQLVEELLALIIVVVLSRVRSTHDHDNELGVFVNLGIANRRFQQVAVFVDPALEVQRR